MRRGGVWVAYNIRSPLSARWRAALAPPLMTPIPVTEFLAPRPEVCEVSGLFLYNTKYIIDNNMDYEAGLRIIKTC